MRSSWHGHAPFGVVVGDHAGRASPRRSEPGADSLIRSTNAVRYRWAASAVLITQPCAAISVTLTWYQFCPRRRARARARDPRTRVPSGSEPICGLKVPGAQCLARPAPDHPCRRELSRCRPRPAPAAPAALASAGAARAGPRAAAGGAAAGGSPPGGGAAARTRPRGRRKARGARAGRLAVPRPTAAVPQGAGAGAGTGTEELPVSPAGAGESGAATRYHSRLWPGTGPSRNLDHQCPRRQAADHGARQQWCAAGHRARRPACHGPGARPPTASGGAGGEAAR